MKLCKCGCGQSVKNEFKRGHNARVDPQYIKRLLKYHFSGSVKGKRPDVSERNKRINPLMTGEKAYHWKGGISDERNKEHKSEKYIAWRKAVFERDNYICRNCGKRGNHHNYLEAHHIKEWTKFPKLRYVISNGITLCQKCHNLTKGTNQYKQDRRVFPWET